MAISPRVGRLEAEAQVAAERARVIERDRRPVIGVEAAHLLEQRAVAALLELEVRRRQQQQRAGVIDKEMAAALVALQGIDQAIEAFQVLVGIPLVPDAQRHEREHVKEVVVEEDGDGRAACGLDAGSDRIVEHVHGDDVGVDVIGDAVPVVQRVKTVGAAETIELRHERHERVRLHHLAQPPDRPFLRQRPAVRRAEHRLHHRARLGERRHPCVASFAVIVGRFNPTL